MSEQQPDQERDAAIQSVASAVLSVASCNDASEGFMAVVERGLPYLIRERAELGGRQTDVDAAYIDTVIGMATSFLEQNRSNQ
jgi:hypothetical protein